MLKIYFILIGLLLTIQPSFASGSIDDCKSLGHQLLNKGKFTEATIQYNHCVTEYGDDGEAFYGIALANFYQGLYDESLSYISKAEDLGRNDSMHLREQIGEAQFNQEDRLEKLSNHLPQKTYPQVSPQVPLIVGLFVIFASIILLFVGVFLPLRLK